jgi:acetyl esterase/lipase
VKRTTLHYGTHHAQVAELWRPDGAPGPLPVVVVIHGGFWRQVYTKRLMHRLCGAVVAHGWVAYNIEYRRVGRFGSGGWPETFDDVAAAIDALAGVEGIDRGRVATCGHSAGGHLALWAATARATGSPASSERDTVRVCAAFSLAGVVDLVAAAQLRLGAGAVAALMGGSPEEHPARYALGSPASLLPIGVPQFLVHGLDDTTVPPSLSGDYAELARSRGDAAEYVPLPGAGHMDMIDPRGAAWREVRARLDRLSAPPSS